MTVVILMAIEEDVVLYGIENFLLVIEALECCGSAIDERSYYFLYRFCCITARHTSLVGSLCMVRDSLLLQDRNQSEEDTCSKTLPIMDDKYISWQEDGLYLCTYIYIGTMTASFET